MLSTTWTEVVGTKPDTKMAVKILQEGKQGKNVLSYDEMEAAILKHLGDIGTVPALSSW